MFFLLFKAEFQWIGIPIGSERKHFHFGYEYRGRKETHKRVDEFYGREWRVWPAKPTEEQRKAVEWSGEMGDDGQ